MAWLYLLGASVLEVTWAVGLRQTDNWKKLVPSVVVIVAYVLGLVLLSAAVRTIPTSVGYSVWVGLGVVGVAALDILVYGEPVAPLKLLCIGMILLGTIGLKVITSA